MKEFNALFVDDEAVLLESNREIYALEGINVYCVESGEEALKAISEKTFNVILTDLNMTGISGIDLAIKVKESLPDLPVFLLTANAFPELPSLAVRAGISKVFKKPVSPEVILFAIKEERDRLSS